MILIALSGGIGSGKSTVARMLAELGAIVVDHDRITHQTYAQGTPGWQQVVDEFGPRVIGADGEIDRKVLGPIAFNTPGGTLRLLRITQPAVMPTAMRTFAEKARQGYQVGVLESAVVIDTGDHWYFDQVWVTYAPEDLAARHAAERQGSNVTFEQAKQRMRHQHPGRAQGELRRPHHPHGPDAGRNAGERARRLAEPARGDRAGDRHEAPVRPARSAAGVGGVCIPVASGRPASTQAWPKRHFVFRGASRS